MRTSLGLAGSQPILICVGRLVSGKGQRLWLPVMRDLQRDWPAACLVLVGDGPDRPLIGSEIQRLGLTDSVKVLGVRNDVRELLDIADVFVSASLTEGFGLSVLEAMAAGKPVVALKLPALAEFITDGVSGILVHSATQDALTNALRQLLSDPDRMQGIGDAAREAARGFTTDRTAHLLGQVYNEVLSTRRIRA